MESDPDYKVELEDEEDEEDEGAVSTKRSGRSLSVPSCSVPENAHKRSLSMRSTRLSVNPDFAAKHRRFLSSVSDSLADDCGRRTARSRERGENKKQESVPKRERSTNGKSQDRSGKSLDRSGKSPDEIVEKSKDNPEKTLETKPSDEEQNKTIVMKSEGSSEKTIETKVSENESNKTVEMESESTTSENKFETISGENESDKRIVTKSEATSEENIMETEPSGGKVDDKKSRIDSSDQVVVSESSEDKSDKNSVLEVEGSKDKSSGGESSQDEKSIKSQDSSVEIKLKATFQDNSDEIPSELSTKLTDSSVQESEKSFDKSTDKTVIVSFQGELDELLNEYRNTRSDKSKDKSRSSQGNNDEDDDDDDDGSPGSRVRSRSRRSETRKRTRRGSDVGEEGGEEERKEKESPAKKKPNVETECSVAPKPIKEGKDMFCWKCHRDGTAVVVCKICPRIFHLRCLLLDETPPADWVCPECSTTLYAENTETRSTAMKSLTLDQLCNLLKFTLARMNSYPGSEWFLKPVDTSTFKDYRDFVVNPMDLSHLEKNIKQKVYGSTYAFYADAQWLQHNSVVYNSHQSKMTNIAKVLVRICKQELDEIETCPECYLNAHTRKDSWFIEACKRPHTLVWAKLKGFPFWPAKAMKTNAEHNVDIRFFGAHDRAWIQLKDVLLFSKLNPGNGKSQGKRFDDSMVEIRQHLKKLRDRFGEFVYPPFKQPYDENKQEEQLEAMLPGYKAASRRYGKLLGPYRNFNSPASNLFQEVKKEPTGSAKRRISMGKRKRKRNSSQNSSKSSETQESDRDSMEVDNNDNFSEKEREKETTNKGNKTDTQASSPKVETPVKTNTDPSRGGVVTSENLMKNGKSVEENSGKEEGDKEKGNEEEADDEPIAKRQLTDVKVTSEKSTPTKTDHAASLQEKLQLISLETVSLKDVEESLGLMEIDEGEDVVEDEKKKEEEEEGKKEDETKEIEEKGDNKEKEEEEKKVLEKEDEEVDDSVLGADDDDFDNNNDDVGDDDDNNNDDDDDDDTTTGKEKISEEPSKEEEGAEKEGDRENKDSDKDGKGNVEGKDIDDKGKSVDKENDEHKEIFVDNSENYPNIVCKKEVGDVEDSTENQVNEVEEEEEEEEEDDFPRIDLTASDDELEDTDKKSDLKVLVNDKPVKDLGSDVINVEPTEPVDTIRAVIDEVVKNATMLCSRKLQANKKLSGIVDNLSQSSSRLSSRNSPRPKTGGECEDEDDLDIDNPKLISMLKARDPSYYSTEELERVAPNRRKGFPLKIRRTVSTASSSCSSDISSVEELKRIYVEQDSRAEVDRKRRASTSIEDLTDDSYSVLDEVSGQFMKKRNVTISLVNEDESKSSKSQLGSVNLSKDVSLSIIREDKTSKDLSLDMECVESDTDEIESGRAGSDGVAGNSSRVKPTARKSFPNAPNFGVLTRGKDGGSEVTRRSLSATDIQVMNQQNGSSSAKSSPNASPRSQGSASSAFYTKISKIAANAPGSEEVQISNTMSLKIQPMETAGSSKSATNSTTSSNSLSATVAPIPSSVATVTLSPRTATVTQAARVLPQQQQPTSSRSLLRGNFGPHTARMDNMSLKLADNMMQMMEEMLQEMSQEGRLEARLKEMEIEKERTSWKHKQELAEYRHNTDLMVLEMRASFESERRNIINSLHTKYLAEKVAAVEETKMKQWCAMCKKEALFYCCWNTAYCNYPCQQEHWPQHMANCAQTNRSNQLKADGITSAVKMMPAPPTTIAGQKTAICVPPTQNHLQATTSLMSTTTVASNNKMMAQQTGQFVPLHHGISMTQQHHQMRMMRAPVIARPPVNFAIRPQQHFMVGQRGPMPHPNFYQ